jgi:hydrogenase maturation factor
MIGEVSHDELITPKGASPGDHILLTKGVPIEGTAILAREFPQQLADILTTDEIQEARDFLYKPGISVLQDARLAIQAGKVTAMHDPTEGGLAGALWELAEACGHTLIINPQAVIIPPISRKICESFGVNPLETIASGALLLTTPPDQASVICHHLQGEGLTCTEIGFVAAGKSQVLQESAEGYIPLHRPERDEIARLFNTSSP